jgi:hypothetical protein
VNLKRGEVLSILMILDRLAESMDWGSGFMTDEDIQAWNAVAATVGHRKAAVNVPETAGGEVLLPLRYSYKLVDVETCASRLDTAVDGDHGKEAITLGCSLRVNHRGDHLCFESEPPVFWH